MSLPGNTYKSLASTMKFGGLVFGGVQVSFSSLFSQCCGSGGEVTKAIVFQWNGQGWLAPYPLTDSLPDLTVLKLLTTSPQRTAKPLWKEQPSWPSESPIPMPGCAVKKMNRQLVCKLCFNKTIKFFHLAFLPWILLFSLF